MTEDSGGIASDAILQMSEGLKYEFYNHPRYESLEAYQDALDIFLDRIEGVPGIVSVYESGTGVSRPGISDIDLVVVVEDDADPEIVRSSIKNAKTDEYFFFHGPEVLTRDTFSDYYNVLPMPKDLYLHYGEELQWEKNRDRFNYLCYLVDSINTTYPMEFLEFLFFPGVSVDHHQLNIAINNIIDLLVPRAVADLCSVEINSRFAIHRLNSLRNDLMLFVDSSGRDAPLLKSFDKSITDLRERWFDLDRTTQEQLLLSRLRDSITACFRFVDHIDSHLKDISVEVAHDQRELRPHEIYHNEYRPDWDIDRAELDTCRFYRNSRVKTCVLPQSVTVNDRLRNGTLYGSIPAEYRDALEKRDRTKTRRDASMETYKYHPLRSRYMSTMQTLFGLKTRITR